MKKRRAGRPKGAVAVGDGATGHLNIRIDAGALGMLETLCARAGRSKSEMVRLLILIAYREASEKR